jgi:hypothetical protein
VTTIGEAAVEIEIDGVLAVDHRVLVVLDQDLPMDIIVGHSWLILPHVHYYKQGTKFVWESNSDLDTNVLSDDPRIEGTTVYVVDTGIAQLVLVNYDDVRIAPEVSSVEREQLLCYK